MIALIITIIVLLILAGVTLAMVVGDNGIIAKARTAKIQTENAEREENEQLQDLEEQIGTLGRAGSKINYSTSEQDTGLKWIDGSTIWQKTYYVQNDNSDNDCLIDSNFSLSKYKLINAWGVCNDSTGNNIIIPYGNAWGADGAIGIIQQKAGDSLNLVERQTYHDIYVTIQYIKITSTN